MTEARVIAMKQALRFMGFALMTGLLLFAGLRVDPFPQFFASQDKLEHAFGLFCFGASLLALFRSMTRVAFFALCIGVSVLIELAQAGLPHRTPSAADALAGVFGACLAWLWMSRDE